jgi:transcriptional regulator with XRE-family HTH domain
VATGDLQRVFGRNLREYRRVHGVSQEALAQSLQVHRTYMGGIERGERNPTLQSVERIAERLGVEPLALLTDLQAGPVASATLAERAPWA